MVIGTALIGLGLAIVLLDIYRSHPESPWLALLSLSPLPRLLRALILGAVGVGLLIFAVVSLNRTLLAPYLRPGKPIVDAVSRHRRLGRGPRIVTIGGGTGLSILLRGLKKYSGNLTAIVTVADDGGSSGRLRRSLLTQLFRYRFLEGEELNGHSFGNLFIAALAGVTGSFDQGIMEAARILSIRGTVLPSTMRDIALLADKTPEMAVEAFRIEGESQISETPGRIRRVHLEPNDPPAYPGAIQAVLNADMIVIGPGSLYTSVIPNLLIPDLVKAIRTSQAFKVFVCNVATQLGETDGYDCKQHVDAIERHIGRGLVDVVVANDRFDYPLPEGISGVDPSATADMMVPLYTGDLVDSDRPWRHDSEKIAETLIALWEERTGPLDLSLDDDLGS